MRFLRRGSVDEAETSTSEAEATELSRSGGETAVRGHTPSKGRATPKRRDAEGRRRGPAPPPPKTQRESARLAKQNRAARAERRKDSADRRSRMMAGDQSALPARDRGPVKAYVRDVVDSRRHLTGLFMPLAGLVLLSVTMPLPHIQQIISYVCMALMLSMALEATLLGRRVVAQTRERFPKEDIKGPGLGWYVFARASQIRRLRVPKPRVQVGDQV
ncbi:MAG TPA: DUF3043 domain-containing protein [Pseudonocardia sp.]|nr:DUF3043 domain-containing protein [Pseudonocardia sp.]